MSAFVDFLSKSRAHGCTCAQKVYKMDSLNMPCFKRGRKVKSLNMPHISRFRTAMKSIYKKNFLCLHAFGLSRNSVLEDFQNSVFNPCTPQAVVVRDDDDAFFTPSTLELK